MEKDIPYSAMLKSKRPRSTPANLKDFRRLDDFSIKIPIKKVEEIKEKIEEKVEEKVEKVEIVEEIEEIVEEIKEEIKVEIKKEEIKKEEIKEEIKEKEKPKKVKKSKKPNYSEMTLVEQKKARKTFKNRFELLRDSWKNYNIPEIDEDTPLDEIHEQYEYYVKNIQIKENSGKYKVYMVLLWLGIEFVCAKLGLNISGYTMLQLKTMNKYERLLIKLGERNYKYTSSEESTWPVEFDLIFMALVNAIIFIFIKLVCDYLNMSNKAEALTDYVSSYLSGVNPQPNTIINGHAIPDVPQNNNQFGNVDIASLLSNFGSMFINKNQTPVTEAKTPRYKPMYDE